MFGARRLDYRDYTVLRMALNAEGGLACKQTSGSCAGATAQPAVQPEGSHREAAGGNKRQKAQQRKCLKPSEMLIFRDTLFYCSTFPAQPGFPSSCKPFACPYPIHLPPHFMLILSLQESNPEDEPLACTAARVHVDMLQDAFRHCSQPLLLS